jgi:Flp pilus assembly protein CpaB
MIVVAVAALIGIGYLTFTTGTEDVYVAAMDLPAYHQITQADLRVWPVQRHDVPDGAVRSRDALLARYTLTAMRAERPFQLTALGPRLPERSIVSAMVALPSTPETTLGGRLARGDRVDVVLSPNDHSGVGQRLTDVLVLDVIDGANAAVVVTVDQPAALTLAAARGSSTITVIRRVPYAGP